MKLIMYTDGGARGNPGPAGIGIFICNPEGDSVLEHGEAIGDSTNNIAEYSALLEGIRKAKQLGATVLECFMDSELAVKQLNGEYKIKNYNLQKLADEVCAEVQELEKITFTHVQREEPGIQRADQLVNFALDYEEKKQKSRK